MAVYLKAKDLKSYCTPESLGLSYCSVQRIELTGASQMLESGKEELCLIIIGGSIQFEWGDICGNAQTCDMLYVPIQSSITISGDGIVMRYGAPCSKQYVFRHIPFVEVDQDERHKVYGKQENGTRRDVWNFIDDNIASGRFLTGICCGRDGGWTAWPPHEHGKEREEVYVYFQMGESFGLQCVYDQMDQPNVYLVREGDVVSIPSGYHPNVGCPCGGIYYAYVMVSTTEGDRNFMDLRTQKIYGDRLE